MKHVTLPALKVPFSQAERIKKYLTDREMLYPNVKIEKDDSCIYFPLTRSDVAIEKFSIVKKMFEVRPIRPKSYKELLALPTEQKEKLPSSYEIIGDIAVLKLPPELLTHKDVIARAILTVHSHIKTVCHIEPVSGELRVRKIEVIDGENTTRTLHKEYGLSLLVDIEKTFFSARLASERNRIAHLVTDGEIIVDLFAGVAPFSIMIARYANPKIIYAFDKNPDAVQLARKNIVKNNVLNKIEILEEDAKDVVRICREKKILADRIIMNLPFSAHEFFDSAVLIANETCIIHYYDVLKEEEFQNRETILRTTAQKHHKTITSFVLKKLKTYAPREFYIVCDITIATLRADVA